MPYLESQLVTQDGLRLRTQTWKPHDDCRAVLALTHGHGEHSGRYNHVGQRLSAAGYALYAYDLRGHGKSGGPRGHIPSYATLLDDLQLILDQARQENPGKKRFLYGHSLGGQITLNFALSRQTDVSGVIVSAPWLRLVYQPPPWKVFLAQALPNIWPTLTMSTELDTAVKMSHDEAHLNSLPDLNLTHAFMSARLGGSALEWAGYALTHASEFTLPLLILHGEADGVIGIGGSEQFCAQARSTDKTLKRYAGLYHEVHNETEREKVFQDMLDWLDQRA